MSPNLKALAVLALLAFGSPASAECYADYKASQEDPLRLHYGVIEVPDSACDPGAAASVAAQRLQAAGWKLLGILSVFGPEGLDERRASAGEYFLRF